MTSNSACPSRSRCIRIEKAPALSAPFHQVAAPAAFTCAGYHAVTGVGLTYTAATYIVAAGNAAVFAQDVSALSGEIATWLTNPFVTNTSPCGGYDVGYGAYGEPNYGNFPYKLGAVTYHLHDAATPAYFGAPPGYPLGGYFSFQGNKLTVCQGSP